MTDPTKAVQAAGQTGSKRRRPRVYGDRRTVSLRMDPDLHERMMDLCDELKTPANTYIQGLIETDLKKRKR